MDFKGVRVLILEGYARQCLPLIRAFRKLGCYVSVLCASKSDVAYVSFFVNEKILGICDRENVPGTVEQVRQLLKTGKYDVVMPTVDFSAELLADNKNEFEKYAHIAIVSKEIYDIAGDKLKTMKVCAQNGIPCPQTIFDIDDIDAIVKRIDKYPIVVKPRVGYGAIGFKKVENEKQLRELFVDRPDEVSEYVFQEYIPQTGLQYECAMFIDNDNEVKTSVVFSKNRWFPVEGGSSTLNITVKRDDIVDDCAKLLKAIGWRGAADIDLIQDERDGKAKIMEINPRVSGSVKIVFESGADQTRQTLELLFGQRVTEYKNYKVGRRLRCSQTDLLWFLKSPKRWKAKPCFFSLWRTSDNTFYWLDPLPWFAFTIAGLKRYKKEMKKRS